MSMSKRVRDVMTLGLASLALLVAACETGDSGSTNTDPEADRATVDAMSGEQGADTAVARRRVVLSERLPYAEVNDELVYGHFAFPADMVEPLPAIIMIHEGMGLNDNIRAMAEKLAGEGYIVLAVDLFGGETATTTGVARVRMQKVIENPEPAAENIRQAYDFLTSVAGAPRVGSLGWSFGGGWSLNTAMLFPEELDATVIFYGQVTNDDDRLRVISSPILGLFGAEDKGISIASVRQFEAALERLRKNYEIHIYPGAGHAFADPSGNAYNAEAADDAWGKMLEFLGLHLAIESDEGA